MTYPFDPEEFPNCKGGMDYAYAVLDDIIPTSIYTYAACERFMEDIERVDDFVLRWDLAEKFMRLFQRFNHVIGEWDTPNIVLEGWQKFLFMNVELFYYEKNNKRRYKSAHLEVGRGNGKALPLDTLVSTPSGLIELGDLSIGDQVYGQDGKACFITNETAIHTPEQYKITFASGLEQLASGNHEWFLAQDGATPLIKNTKDMFESTATHRIELATPFEGTESDLPIDPWVLGFWLGSGKIGQHILKCGIADAKDVLKYVESRGYSATVKYVDGGTIAEISPQGLHYQLHSLKTTRGKYIPNDYLIAPVEQRRELLRGLLDSTGLISNDIGGEIRVCAQQPAMILQIHQLLSGLGIKSRYLTQDSTISDLGYGWGVGFPPIAPFPLFRLKHRQLVGEALPNGSCQVITDISLVDEASRVPMKCIEVDSPDHSYVITGHYIPTHNSAMASCTGLIYLNLVETVKGNKVYSCATKKEQARIVLDSSREMAKANESYTKKTGVEVFAHHIAHEASGSEFRALSSDSKSLDGLQPVLAIIDELHAHRDRAVFDVIDSAMSKRKDSYMFVITTAGFSLTGIGHSQSQYAKKVAIGEIDDDSFFSLVYTLDEEDDWKNPENWVKANPNWSVSVDPDSFKSKALKAMANPVDEINFKVKHLNLWQNALTQYFSVKLWDRLGNKELSLESFRGKKCFIGIDLASKVDLTAFAYIFKNEETGKFSIITRSYCPEGTIQTSKNNSYSGWVKEGHLIQTPGQAINYIKLRKDFLQEVRSVKAQEIAYDPWNAVEFSQELSSERLEMVEYRMNTANFSEPMKRLEALIREGAIEHDGNPLVSWCLSNVVAKPDANDNVFPRKDHESMKIDVIVAILEALGLWIQHEENTSVYEGREIRIL